MIEDIKIEDVNNLLASSPDPNVHIMFRHEWGAAPPQYVLEFENPVKSVSYYFTNTKRCNHYVECTKILQKMQKKDFDEGYPDIQYNFLIGNDGNVYEGTGWNNRVIKIPQNTLETDGSDRLIIGYIAQSDDSGEKTKQLEKLGYELIKWGSKRKLIKAK